MDKLHLALFSTRLKNWVSKREIRTSKLYRLQEPRFLMLVQDVSLPRVISSFSKNCFQFFALLLWILAA
jgi:hypothetical protein